MLFPRPAVVVLCPGRQPRLPPSHSHPPPPLPTPLTCRPADWCSSPAALHAHHVHGCFAPAAPRSPKMWSTGSRPTLAEGAAAAAAAAPRRACAPWRRRCLLGPAACAAGWGALQAEHGSAVLLWRARGCRALHAAAATSPLGVRRESCLHTACPSSRQAGFPPPPLVCHLAACRACRRTGAFVNIVERKQSGGTWGSAAINWDA
jgi:hypothetical protein